MVIGVLLSGFLSGLFGTILALTAGFPLWVAILLYPMLGTLGAVGFITFAMTRSTDRVRADMPEFATEMR